jgi:hypothetical protein
MSTIGCVWSSVTNPSKMYMDWPSTHDNMLNCGEIGDPPPVNTFVHVNATVSRTHTSLNVYFCPNISVYSPPTIHNWPSCAAMPKLMRLGGHALFV